jgi:hypothetical protein
MFSSLSFCEKSYYSKQLFFSSLFVFLMNFLFELFPKNLLCCVVASSCLNFS